MATKKAAPAPKKAAPAPKAAPSGLDLHALAKQLAGPVSKQLGPVPQTANGAAKAGARVRTWVEIIMVVLQALLNANIFDQVARSKGYVAVQSDLFDQVAASRGYARK